MLRACVFSILLHAALAARDCPSGYENLFGDKCVKYLVDKTYTFDAARDACQQDGGDLVSIHSKEENEAYYQNMKNTTWAKWIGLMTESGEESQWTDGTPVDFIETFAGTVKCSGAGNAYIMVAIGYADGIWGCLPRTIEFQAICQLGGPAPGEQSNTTSTTTTASPQPTVCPHGYKNLYKNKCVKFLVQRTYEYEDARSACQRDGGDLVSIHSQEENDVYFELMEDMVHSKWIGLTADAREWTDGTPVDFNGTSLNAYVCARYPDSAYIMMSTEYENGAWNCAFKVDAHQAICEITPLSGGNQPVAENIQPVR